MDLGCETDAPSPNQFTLLESGGNAGESNPPDATHRDVPPDLKSGGCTSIPRASARELTAHAREREPPYSPPSDAAEPSSTGSVSATRVDGFDWESAQAAPPPTRQTAMMPTV